MESTGTSQSRKNLTGIPLVDVFSIIYFGDDEVPPENQLGTICFTDRYEEDGMDLYKVDKVDMRMPSIKFGDPIMVTGAPNTNIRDFDIEFDLFCGAYTGSIEGVDWEELGECRVSVAEDYIYSADSTSQIRVQYGLFTSATIANVAITLLGNNGDTNVHGFVFASNSRLHSPTCSSVLFWMNSDNRVRVTNGVIPLSKSLVGVPLKSEFSLAISLMCGGVELKTKLSVVVSEESFIFEDKYCGNKLQVKVTFKCRD